MLQVIIIAGVLFVFFLYLKSRGSSGTKKPEDELDLRCELYHEEVMNFLRRLKRFRSQTRIRRLESEIERFQKVMDLDDLLEKGEQESRPQKAIDYYLEALSFIINNDFEKERKGEIEEKIRTLQHMEKNKPVHSNREIEK